ncbi:MAG TPA: hypothetical protein VG433_06240 [Pirellulales bacterium]|nr:hypothetical protein [Pirellulales bacterium]
MQSKTRGRWWLVVVLAAAALPLAMPVGAQQPAAVKPPTAARAGEAAHAKDAQSKLGERIVGQARQMLAAFPTSSYSHTTKIDPQRGLCEVDCSGFVATVLTAVSPEHVAVIPLRKAGRKRPLAEDFYAAFAAAEQGRIAGWQTIGQVQDARPGDVIAWWKEEHKKGENTGHVMIVAESPVLERPGQWRIRIFDSTATPHASDTRPKGTTGLGSGTIWLDVGSDGRILGYHWKSASGKLNEHPVAIGRAV